MQFLCKELASWIVQILADHCASQAWVEGKNQSAGEASRIAVQLSVGGAAWGLAVGLAATLWLRFMFENAHAEITLTASLPAQIVPLHQCIGDQSGDIQ